MLIALIAAGLAAAQPALRPELEPMRFLVGHCWRGAMAKGAKHDTHCFEPVFDGQHVRDRHEALLAPARLRAVEREALAVFAARIARARVREGRRRVDVRVVDVVGLDELHVQEVHAPVGAGDACAVR